jgi:hypothetical protein
MVTLTAAQAVMLLVVLVLV